MQDAWENVDLGGRRVRQVRRGMVLPFQPVTLTFRDIHYYVDLPRVSINFSHPRIYLKPLPALVLLFALLRSMCCSAACHWNCLAGPASR